MSNDIDNVSDCNLIHPDSRDMLDGGGGASESKLLCGRPSPFFRFC